MAAARKKTKQPSDLLAEKYARLEYLRRLQAQAEQDRKLAAADQVLAKLGIEPNHRESCDRRPDCDCPQKRFLELPDDDLDVLYGGSAGGGKSFALMAYTLRACVRFDGLQAYWFRNSFPELDTSIIKMLVRINFAADIGCKWVASKYELVFPNGSVLRLAHAKNEAEAVALRSAEINLLILDERTTISPKVVDLLYTRVRSGVAGVPCLGIRSATNPGGVAHGVVKADYIKATDYGSTEIESDKYGRRRIFIQAKLSDNPHLMKDGAYQKALAGLPDDLRRALLDGDWNVLSGQMFTELSRERHVVEPWELPPSWRRYAGVDWGWSAPWSTLWGALDEDGRVWIYRETYQRAVRESEQARWILRVEGNEDIVARFADDAMWFSRGEAKSIAEVYEDNGCVLEKAGKGANSRRIGFARIHDYLAEHPACAHHRAMGWETCPLLHIFSGCENLYRELEELPYSEKNPEESDPRAADHAVDALRYLLTNIGNEPKWYFLQAGDVMSLVMETDARTTPPPPMQTLGGHPILPDGADPWANYQ